MKKVFLFSLLSLFTIHSQAQDLNQKVMNAHRAARESKNCQAIKPFYYEIGNRTHKILGDSLGLRAPDEHTIMNIASATKWMTGAYALEKLNGNLSRYQLSLLNFTSGFDQFSNCKGTSTVKDCYTSGTNGARTLTSIGKFSYNGGHMQALGVELGLHEYNAEDLSLDFSQTLGVDVSFFSPQLAGAINTTSFEYAQFLRKVMNSELLMGSFLGKGAVCASPEFCPSKAVYSPMRLGLDYDYSIGHWIENDATAGDGAFSSAGAFGFYPWISKDKRFYGIIARESQLPGTGQDSILCGQDIRKAFLE